MAYNEFRKLKDVKETLLLLLERRPMHAKELAKKLGLDRSTVSEYLNQFTREGRLEKHKKGRVAYYGIIR